MGKIIISLVFFLSMLFQGCGNRSANNSTDENSNENGEVKEANSDKDSIAHLPNDTINLSANELKLKKGNDQLIEPQWKREEIKNGQVPDCYNFTPIVGFVNNYLQVVVGNNTDIAMKVMHWATEKCVRYVFINSGSTFKLLNIPEGRYYVKIAYGKNWSTKIENNKCIGKFMDRPLYQKGTDVLDFGIKTTNKGYSIPSFELQLDVIVSNISNSFRSENISESEFNR